MDELARERGLSIEALADIRVQVSVLLGSCEAKVRDVLSLAPGSIVALETRADSTVNVSVNGVVVASGDIVELDDGALAVEIRDIKTSPARSGR